MKTIERRLQELERLQQQPQRFMVADVVISPADYDALFVLDGDEEQRAAIWARYPGLHQLQPGDFVYWCFHVAGETPTRPQGYADVSPCPEWVTAETFQHYRHWVHVADHRHAGRVEYDEWRAEAI